MFASPFTGKARVALLLVACSVVVWPVLWHVMEPLPQAEAWDDDGWSETVLLSAKSNAQFPGRSQVQAVRRVNMPYFDGEVKRWRTAIFWFGRVASTENSVDVRVGYNDEELWMHIAVFDKRVWYDTTPSPQEVAEWDAVEVYLHLDGNVGSAPDGNAYRFISQLNSAEPGEAYQVAYRGNGATWALADISFANTAFYRGDSPNNDVDDRGWATTIHIPFASLGLSGPPLQGSVWGLAAIVHDRDDAAGTSIAHEVWPEGADPGRPVAWGQLGFGFPEYDPPLVAPGGTVIIRQGLNGTVVADGAVGGGTTCGDGLDFWTEWGEENYAGRGEFNIQNQVDVADWPCFSKVYLTFPLDVVPAGKVIVSATLTLHEFGNAGNPGEDIAPSWVQVLTIADDWDEDTLAWNNAPLAVENVAMSKVYPVAPVELPGVPFDWDVSLAVAETYAKGGPLRIAMYSADTSYSTGKYFVSSDSTLADGHPELTVVWGEPVATVRKAVCPVNPSHGQQVTYTLHLLGSGQALTLTDDLPAQVGPPASIQLEGGGNAVYDPVDHRIGWTGNLAVGQPVTLTFPVTVLVRGPLAVYNTVVLADGGGNISSDTAFFVIDALSMYVPVILRGSPA